MTAIYSTTSADGTRLAVTRIAGALCLTIVEDAETNAGVVLSAQQEAEMLQALSPDIRERVRAVMQDVDELKDGPLQRELRQMLKAHVSSAPGAQLGAV